MRSFAGPALPLVFEPRLSGTPLLQHAPGFPRASRFAALAAATALVSPAARGACTCGAPVAFALPAGTSSKFNPGFETSIGLYTSVGGVRRLILGENYGYELFTLANPASPVLSNYHDISGIPGYGQSGDGFSLVNAVSVAPDGTRALVNYRSPHGTLLLKPNGEYFALAGEYTPSETSASALMKTGSRYLAFSAAPGSAPIVSNVTNPGTSATTFPSFAVPSPLAISRLVVAGTWLVYRTLTKIVVVDGSGAATGTLPQALVVRKQLDAVAFGLPAGDAISGFTAGVHPVTGELHVVAEATSAGGFSGFAALRSMDGVNYTSLGPKVVAPSPWSGAGTRTVDGGAVVASATGLRSFHWTQGVDFSWKLFSFSLDAWGSDESPSAAYTFPGSSTVAATAGFEAGGGQHYLYVAATYASFAIPVSCPATGPVGLRFHPLDPCRLVDTRLADGPLGGPALGASGSPARVLPLGTSSCGVPPDAASVALNVTITGASTTGAVQLWPAHLGSTETTWTAFRADTTRASFLVLGLPPDGTGQVKAALTSSGPAHLVLDVAGYFR